MTRRSPVERTDELIATICDRLADGESMASICRDDGMPNYSTIKVWQANDAEMESRIARAREVGYEVRADRAILAAKTATDAPLGRLAFDAERWYLGKLSNAFSDDKARKHELSGPGGEAIAFTGFDVKFV